MKDITWRAHVDRPPSSKVDFLPPRTTLAGGGIYGGHSLTGISTFGDGWAGWAPRALSRYNMRSSPKSTVIAQKLIFLPPRTTLIDTLSRIYGGHSFWWQYIWWTLSHGYFVFWWQSSWVSPSCMTTIYHMTNSPRLTTIGKSWFSSSKNNSYRLLVMVALPLILLIYKDRRGGAEEVQPPTATVGSIPLKTSLIC